MTKIISTLENYLIEGVWLPISNEVEVLEEDLHKYLSLVGVKVVSAENEVKTELPIEVTNIETSIETTLDKEI